MPWERPRRQWEKQPMQRILNWKAKSKVMKSEAAEKARKLKEKATEKANEAVDKIHKK